MTCRTYDCRVFPAAGVGIDDDDDKVLIARQVRRWKFTYPTPDDRTRHDAVCAAATFLHEHGELVPDDEVPRNATQRAVRAIELHDDFLPRDDEIRCVPEESREQRTRSDATRSEKP
jgi:uncharacterized protein